MDEESTRILLALAKDLAKQRTDKALGKAGEILIDLIDSGCQDAEVLALAAAYILQGPQACKYEVKQEAISLVDRAVALAPDDISVLEAAVSCYGLILKEFPDKLDDIIRLSLKILDLDPCNVKSMITLASHREHPRVKLSLEETIVMMEWAKEIKPSHTLIDFTLGKLYAEAGKSGKAKVSYNQIVTETAANSPEASDTPEQMKSANPKS